MRLVRVMIIWMFLSVMVCCLMYCLDLCPVPCHIVYLYVSLIKCSNGKSLIYKVATRLDGCSNNVVRCFGRVSFDLSSSRRSKHGSTTWNKARMCIHGCSRLYKVVLCWDKVVQCRTKFNEVKHGCIMFKQG